MAHIKGEVMEKCQHGYETCEDCSIEEFEKWIKAFKDVIVKLDSHLSIARHRYIGHLWPDDFIREVDETITEARRLTSE